MIIPLGSTREVRHLRATGYRVQAGPLMLIAARNADPDHTRVAYAIGRQVGTAVRRNRLRRRLREIMRRMDADDRLPFSSYLLVCRADSVNLRSSDLQDLVERMLLDMTARASVGAAST